MLCPSYYLLCFSSTKPENKRAEQVLPRSGREGWGVRGGEAAQTMYTHVSKCKNNKIFKKHQKKKKKKTHP
jgi:hypothetical protein